MNVTRTDGSFANDTCDSIGQLKAEDFEYGGSTPRLHEPFGYERNAKERRGSERSFSTPGR